MSKTASVKNKNRISDVRRSGHGTVSAVETYSPRVYAEAVTAGGRGSRVRGMYGSAHTDRGGFAASRMKKAHVGGSTATAKAEARRPGALAGRVEREIVHGRPLDLDMPARTLRRVGKVLSLRNLLALLLAAMVVSAAVIIMLFNFEQAVIYGNTKYSQEQIESFITRGRMGENTFVMALKYHHRTVEDIPFIDQIDIDIINPSTVRVNIKEKPLDAFVFFGGKNVYFSKDGLIETVSGRNIEGPTRVNGVVLTHSETGKQALAKNQYGLDLSLELLRILDKYNMHADSIDVDQKSSLTVTFGDVKVLIGKTGYDQKMYKIHQILPQLEGRSGVISMTGFAYEYGGTDIVLSQEKPVEGETSEEPADKPAEEDAEEPTDKPAEDADEEAVDAAGKAEEVEKTGDSAESPEKEKTKEKTEEKDSEKTGEAAEPTEPGGAETPGESQKTEITGTDAEAGANIQAAANTQAGTDEKAQAVEPAGAQTEAAAGSGETEKTEQTQKAQETEKNREREN